MGNAASNNGSMAVEKKIKVKKLVNRDATTQDKSTKNPHAMIPNPPVKIPSIPSPACEELDDDLLCGYMTMSEEITSRYTILDSMGHGHFGVVREAVDIVSGQHVAIKGIPKKKVSELEVLRREISIMRELNHPNIIKLIATHEDDRYLYIVTELCTGGELFDAIIVKGHFSEEEAAVCIRSILSGIEHCHRHGIVHRDLKPENLLYSDKSQNTLKVIDFGLSKIRLQNAGDKKEEMMKTRVGTPYYIAPEVLAKNYTKACDLWSTGVILYILLCGYPPFYGSSEDSIFRRVRRGTYTFPSPEWDAVSDSAKDLVKKLLEIDISKRLSASEALKHEWVKNVGPFKPLNSPINVNTQLNPSIVDNMRSFANSRKLRKAAMRFIASTLDGPEIELLNKAFLETDTDRNGMVNCKELYSALIDLGYEGDLENVRVLLEGIDVDGDGLIDYNEFLAAAMMKQQAMKEDRIRAAFMHFDFDNTGYITLENLKQLLPGENVEDYMSEADLDKDMIIDYEEFLDLMYNDYVAPPILLPTAGETIEESPVIPPIVFNEFHSDVIVDNTEL